MARMHPSAPPTASFIVMGIFVVGFFLTKLTGVQLKESKRIIIASFTAILATTLFFIAWRRRHERGDPNWKQKWEDRNPWQS